MRQHFPKPGQTTQHISTELFHFSEQNSNLYTNNVLVLHYWHHRATWRDSNPPELHETIFSNARGWPSRMCYSEKKQKTIVWDIDWKDAIARAEGQGSWQAFGLTWLCRAYHHMTQVVQQFCKGQWNSWDSNWLCRAGHLMHLSQMRSKLMHHGVTLCPALH